MHSSRSILDVSSFGTVSVLSFNPIRIRALCIEEPQLGCISSDVINEYVTYQVTDEYKRT